MTLREDFTFDGRVDRSLVAVFVLLNGIVLLNALLHKSIVGYDASDHLNYIQVLSEGRLPLPDESFEFFAPPLPYALPAFVDMLTDRIGVVKLAQLLNVCWSIGLTWSLVRFCRIIAPGNRQLALWSLLLLGMVPAYYRTFAFVRGEPLAAFLAMFAAERALRIWTERSARLGPWLVLGALLGFLMLAKQWGAYTIAATGVFTVWCAAADPGHWRRYARGLAAAALVCVAISGWFYASLYIRFGTPAAFNQEPSPHWSLSNRPREFYLEAGWSKLFVDPVRATFSPGSDSNAQFFPVLYSDLWGDYWCYWVVQGQERNTGDWVVGDKVLVLAESDPSATNRSSIAPYLGRVNLAATFPTAVMLGGLLLGVRSCWRLSASPRKAGNHTAGLALAATVVTISVLGYLFLLIRYPTLDVKASYLLSVVPFVALLGAAFLDGLTRRAPRASLIVRTLLILATVHNAPVFITRFIGR